MRRHKFIAGNWKMNPTRAAAAVELARAVVTGLGKENRVNVALCPPFPYLGVVREAIKDSAISLGGQNCYVQNEGAFTGEVSPAMLLDAGCKYVILGHSERRHQLRESDEFIHRKVRAALSAGLHVILCIGETLEERQANHTEKVLDFQVTKGLAGIAEADLEKLTLAYEPVWAIGTGHNATPQQAQDTHAFIRRRVGQIASEKVAQSLPIQYGGSVKPENAAALFAQPDVDGGLIGGASLKAESFLAIVRAAVE